MSPNAQKQIRSYQLKEYVEWSLQMWGKSTVTKSKQLEYSICLMNGVKNLLNKLISNGALLMKKNIKTNILNTINVNGSYLLLNNNNDKYGNNYIFSLNNILLDNDISGNPDDINDYKKIILIIILLY